MHFSVHVANMGIRVGFECQRSVAKIRWKTSAEFNRGGTRSGWRDQEGDALPALRTCIGAGHIRDMYTFKPKICQDSQKF